MLFRQLFDPVSSTYTYILADEPTREAALATPCHADHVTGAWLMKVAFGSRIGLAPGYGTENVDLPPVHGELVCFGACRLEVRAAPGHTRSSSRSPCRRTCARGAPRPAPGPTTRGLTRTASLAGGMVRWRDLGLPATMPPTGIP